jgi:DNA-binding transcriptional LysR family regulator
MALPRYTPRQLDAFVTVADVLSFTEAGHRLALTGSAVSQLVSELEETLGFRLFDRSTRRVKLSSAGREFLASASSVLKHMDLAQTAADDVRNRAAGIIRVAAPLVVASVILPKIIKSYYACRPKVKIQIRDFPVEALVDSVSRGDVDIALGPDRFVSDDVHRFELFQSPWVLWCSKVHPLASKKIVTWDDVRAYPLVAAGRDHEKSVEQMHITLPGEKRVTPFEVVDNISTALGMAAVNLAATLSPAYVGALAKPLGLKMRRIMNPEVMRHVCLYHSTTRFSSPAAEGFVEYLKDYFSKQALLTSKTGS